MNSDAVRLQSSKEARCFSSLTFMPATENFRRGLYSAFANALKRSDTSHARTRIRLYHAERSQEDEVKNIPVSHRTAESLSLHNTNRLELDDLLGDAGVVADFDDLVDVFVRARRFFGDAFLSTLP
jgi:hypothetical protein